MIQLPFKVARIIKVGKFLLPTLSIGIIYGVFDKIGIGNSVGIIALAVGALAAFCFYHLNAFDALTRNSYKPKQVITIAFSSMLLVVMGLFFTTVFFDWPRNFKQFFGFEAEQQAEPAENILSFQIDGEFYDECHYPFVYPDSILKVKSSDTITVVKEYSENDFEHFAKAPAWVATDEQNYDIGYKGYYLPFHLTTKNVKKIVNLENKFRVFVEVKEVPKFINVGQTCAGDGAFHESNDVVILTNEKIRYFKDVTFRKGDFYTSKPDEQNSFKIYFKIKNPGYYKVKVEIPYTFNGKRYKETFSIPDLVAPVEYKTWYALDPNPNIRKSENHMKWNGQEYKSLLPEIY